MICSSSKRITIFNCRNIYNISRIKNCYPMQKLGKLLCYPPKFYNLFIQEAIYPAPKPLLIFTTDMFELQPFNMPNKAVRPPKAVP